MSELDGRIALVTGASRGIGEAAARALAAAGARVALTDLSAPTGLASELGGMARAQDVTSESDWAEVMEWLKAEAGGLDILVNNAGILQMKPISETSLEEWRKLHAVNVEGVFLGTKAAIPLLADRAPKWKGGTSIINMSSIMGLVGGANSACYNASKGAVRIFSKSAALELAPMRIRVNSIHPGVIDTAMGSEVIEGVSAATGVGANEARDQIAAAHALGSMGEASDIGHAVAYLASDKAAFMTGSEMVVDGGYTAG
ncbi:SDR family oxidoreductase [Altererythrobacter arenosus]|uniref:SDR family oxidoreductase n=1 Tax=Altererythrobacter arenosus TaxID=3032592 RepID=A0ABY8FLY9_9SPHN|nr:SDR family oxidoreductase [Altererythrobacter sp. CAU 1644]WFL76031.1 SDR family oxidoreductase [Altererythrobacter sp. CAU 1644]